MPLIEARSVTVRYGEQSVLEAASLALEPGELVLAIGPNGAGKSTLARVLAGLEQPNTGEIIHAGELRIGYVPQASRRDPSLPLTAGDFLKLAAEASPDTGATFEALGIAPLLGRPLAGLSGGELRRVLLARALGRKANLLVLDEPLAGVDAASQEPLYRFIAAHTRASKAATLLIAHEVLSVLPLADHVIGLDSRVVAQGTPHEVASGAEFQRLFGAAMAEAAIHVTKNAPCSLQKAGHG